MDQPNEPIKKGTRWWTVVFSGTLLGIAVAILVLASKSPLETDHIQFFGNGIHTEKQQEFMNFIMKFGRSYSTKEEMTKRFELFSQMHDKVKENNEKNPYVTMEINKFADLTIEEVEAMHSNGLIVRNKQHSHKKFMN